MSGFILEQLQKACLAHLREKVAESVRLLWSRIADLTSEREKLSQMLVHVDALTANSIYGGQGTDKSPVKCSPYSAHDFSSKLDVEKEEVFLSTVAESRLFLKSFIETHISIALPELCALHPCHARVTSLSVWLIRKQASAQRGALMSFLSSYARRKLEEVSSIGAKQLRKGISVSTPAASSILDVSHSEMVGEGEREDASDHVFPVSVLAQLTGFDRNRNESKAFELPQMPLSRHGRADKITDQLTELNVFFSIQNVVDQGTKKSFHSNITKLSVNPIDLHHFISKPFTIHNKPIGSLEVRYKTPTRLLSSDSVFQNSVVRLCEVIHDIIEVVASCVGDFMIEWLVPAAGSIPIDSCLTADTASTNSFATDYPSLVSKSKSIHFVERTATSLSSSNSTSIPPYSSTIKSLLPPTSYATLPPPLPPPPPPPLPVKVISLEKATCWSKPPLVKSIDNRGAHMRDTVGQKDANVTHASIIKSQLSLSEVCVCVENTKRILLSSITYLAGEKRRLESNLRGGSEAAGKLSIQMVKMLTSCMPFLLYFDAFLMQENTRSKNSSLIIQPCVPVNPFTAHRVPGMGSYTDTISTYDPQTRWENFIELDSYNSLFHRQLNQLNHEQFHQCLYPSDLLIAAVSQNLITPLSMGYVMTASSRQSTLSYFTACKSLPLLRQKAPNLIYHFIGRYYLFNFLRSKSEESTPIARIIFNDLYGPRNESRIKWYELTQVLKGMKNESIDLMNILLKLKNMKN